MSNSLNRTAPAMSEADMQAMIRRHVAEKGVTLCPVVFAAPSQAGLLADRDAKVRAELMAKTQRLEDDAREATRQRNSDKARRGWTAAAKMRRSATMRALYAKNRAETGNSRG